MFFKNARFLKITAELHPDLLGVLNDRLSEFKFSSPGSQQLSSIGWAKPFNQEDNFYYRSGNRLLMVLKTETRILPPAVLNKKANEIIQGKEQTEGRTVGKREQQEIKHDLLMKLLPNCFTKDSLVYGYIDLDDMLLVVNSATDSHVELFAAMLRKALGSLPIIPPQGNATCSQIMTDWLIKSPPEKFEVMEKAILSSHESGKVTLKDQDLTGEEVIKHIEHGKEVLELQLSFDETLIFTMRNDLTIKSIRFSDVIAEQNDDIPKDDAIGRLDADFALMSGELSRLFKSIFEAFGVDHE
jgi:recombination associated protein RdgC